MDLIVTYLFQGPSLVTLINALTLAYLHSTGMINYYALLQSICDIHACHTCSLGFLILGAGQKLSSSLTENINILNIIYIPNWRQICGQSPVFLKIT